jgi:hypothetical protein
MLELLLCSLLTILPDYLFRRYVQGKRSPTTAGEKFTPTSNTAPHLFLKTPDYQPIWLTRCLHSNRQHVSMLELSIN